MKQITFQIDDTGKVLVFPQDLTGDMLPEEQKFTAQDIKLVHDCLFNIEHNPQFYGITSKDFKNRTFEEKISDFNKFVGPVDSGEGKLLNELVGEEGNVNKLHNPPPVDASNVFHIPTEDGTGIVIKE